MPNVCFFHHLAPSTAVLPVVQERLPPLLCSLQHTRCAPSPATGLTRCLLPWAPTQMSSQHLLPMCPKPAPPSWWLLHTGHHPPPMCSQARHHTAQDPSFLEDIYHTPASLRKDTFPASKPRWTPHVCRGGAHLHGSVLVEGRREGNRAFCMEQVYFQRAASLAEEDKVLKWLPGVTPVPLGCLTLNTLSPSD
jgi:hypothetical protein